MESNQTPDRKTKEDYMISYRLHRDTIGNLSEYAFPVEYGSYVSARTINLGSAAARTSLETVEGMVSLHRWFNAFSKAFDIAAKFDDQVEQQRAVFSHADWRLMDESMEKAVNALRNKLEEVAQDT